MRSPEQAIELLRGSWRRQVGDWLGGGGEWPLRLSLSVPGERQASAHWATFEAWRSAWKDWRGAGEVHWAERRWPLLGRQAVPEALVLGDVTVLAELLGETSRWQRARARFDAWAGRWPILAAELCRQYELLAGADDIEFARLYDMLAWLQTHPSSNLFARQLPVAGLDSKWLETRTGVIGDWLRALAGLPRETDFWQASGLRREPDRLRLRVLDPALRACVGGLGDIHAPFDELAALALPVRRVFIVENKQTGLAFDDLPGAVVLMARGYAVDRLHELSWLQAANRVDYWGDLDTHGLAILGRLRGHLPQVRSLLMDEATLLAHRALWVTEPVPHRTEVIDHLDAVEQALFRDLRGDRWGVRVRLEQERIGWDFAWPRIERAD
ncbi:MAG: Wadjet anti-phage system protein JetD domain-containing protein [Rhodanobacter sp.]